MGQEMGNGRRSLGREGTISKPTRGKGVAAMVQHLLGVVGRLGVSLDAQVAQHGIRLPAAKEADGIGVNGGTQEGSGTTGTE